MLERCLWCDNQIRTPLTVAWLFSLHSYQAPKLCHRCQPLFEPPEQPQCPQCGRFQTDELVCGDCRAWNERGFVALKNQALYPYHGLMQEYLDRYKFQGDYALRLLVKARLEQCVVNAGALIVPIPVTAKQRQQRKFNQVEGWLTDVDWVSALVAKPKTISQHQRSRRERMQTWQPFAINPAVVAQLQGGSVCLVDDVYTTGQTLHQAQQLLSQNGVIQVRSVTLAR
ncbi:ComF family protein [Fructilactobacillus carniphilus]|uniref:ComF family protein n=1 Tax=Fructilactobacillus carniphilus TaxID=2940297 RepID=A0ABY5BYG0_9LACO|nr:phosphoribosyltransferase family protein [Fructilactobacillus carniphilus]USS90070.1 ComF family protein [Fructilactobacillus carniphilus]